MGRFLAFDWVHLDTFKQKMQGFVVVFGAGRVAGPLVAYLLRHVGVSLCVASAVRGEAEALCAKYRPSGGDDAARLTTMDVDVLDDHETVEELCAKADCIVAFVPEPAQVRIAEACVKAKTKLVTASYPSPGIKNLDAAAAAAGVPILCEMGLDPGMDHMITMKIIDEIKAKNGKVLAFSSVCGGLPAPDAANNPIKYKFSWSPLGALRAAQRPAQYLKNGEVVTIPGEDVLAHAVPIDLFPNHELEQIPNGYALPYAEYYGIPDAKSIFRGTLRFKGFCSVISQCVKIGLLNETDIVEANTLWVELLAARLKQSGNILDTATQVFLHWLGLDAPGVATTKTQSIMHSFCDILLTKLSFAPGECDLVLMQVGVEAEYPDGSRMVHEAFFEAAGEPHGETIMAKTVALTSAIGVKLLLEDRVNAVGVVGPTHREIYEPALELLVAEGIHFEWRTSPRL